MALNATVQPIFAPANYNIFQIINFKWYEALPRIDKYDPNPILMDNISKKMNRIAWHSRYRTVYPHSLEYMALRSITLDNIQQLTKILKHPNFDVNKPIDKKYNLTALQFAVMKNKYAIVQLLLMHGANINQGDEQKNTPLMIAVANQSLETINTLLKNGCDRGLKNIYGIDAEGKAQIQQSEGIKNFIKEYPVCQRKFPKFKVNLDIEKLTQPKKLDHYDKYDIKVKIFKNPFNNFKGQYQLLMSTLEQTLEQKKESFQKI